MVSTQTFNRQLKLGKAGEKKVFEYLNNLPETIDVLDLSMHKLFQHYGVDGLLIEDIEDLQLNSTFFDVKTDFQHHMTGNLFMETTSSTGKEGGILSTKAQVFYYYDPFEGILFKVPIYSVKQWYKREGISYAHKKVKTLTGQDEGTIGIAISPKQLMDDGVPITITQIGHLSEEDYT